MPDYIIRQRGHFGLEDLASLDVCQPSARPVTKIFVQAELCTGRQHLKTYRGLRSFMRGTVCLIHSKTLFYQYYVFRITLRHFFPVVSLLTHSGINTLEVVKRCNAHYINIQFTYLYYTFFTRHFKLSLIAMANAYCYNTFSGLSSVPRANDDYRSS